ncbi:TetR/AcrR family transcriptional regulator [Kordiimonas lipolytica]|uniref:TetR/AcrR family transcriptional regulator n=1 Tax=Kordiimonas lipolytica TaxID=1662421 RepID=A0ABV8U8U2_9PROT|nr:TetR/AcrR family transcriptional regulator [Kordiimonas lipolytica]
MSDRQKDTQKRTRLNPEERRRQLLDAAVELFAERGIGEAKHADIAKRTGVSVATTFVYFPTREALIDAVLDDVAEKNLAIFAEVDPTGLSTAELLTALAEHATSRLDDERAFAQVWLNWSTNFAPHIREKFLECQNIVLDNLTAILDAATPGRQKGRGARDDARILLAASQMLTVMKLDGISKERRDRFTEHTIDVVLAYTGEK